MADWKRESSRIRIDAPEYSRNSRSGQGFVMNRRSFAGDIFMTGDNGENDGESGRLLTARERAAVASHVAEQLLTLADFARRPPAAASRVRRAISALVEPPSAPLPPALAAAADVCAGLLVWLAGSSPSYPMLDDVLRSIGWALHAMDRTERQYAAPLAMAACILAAAAMARHQRRDGMTAADLPRGMVGAMVTAAMEHGERVKEAAE
jgi:hypothetical protein